jgi:DNA-directed RNA polymerase specialized sigma24 family protein
MNDAQHENHSGVNRLLARAAARDSEGWHALFERNRERLRRMVALRMDQRLQGRFEPSDVIQEAHIEAHFERLSNAEVAQALVLSTSAASKRYVRALERLKEILIAGRGGLMEL